MQIKGRQGAPIPSEFVGEISDDGQVIRIDDTKNPAFWLEIRLTDAELSKMTLQRQFSKEEEAG